MDGCTKPKKPKEDYASLKEALKDYDAGLNVDTATLSRLASQEQGSYECEFFFGAEDDKLNRITNCPKQEYHKNFTLLENLTLDSLPRKYRHQTVLDTVKLQGALTVKLIISFVSKNRPDYHPRSGKRYAHSNMKGRKNMGRCGTGMVVRVDVENVEGQTCGCDECRVDGGDAKTWYRVVVATALHVVYDQSEADETKVEFSLQTEDGVNVSETLKGGWNHEELNPDVATLSAFTHNERLCSNLARVNENFRQQRYETGKLLWIRVDDGGYFSSIVSHPHGQAKHVSFGNFLSEVPFARMIFQEPKSTPLSPLSASVSKILRFYFGNTTTIYNTPTCPGSSGAFIFRYKHDHISLHECVEGTDRFNMAGDDSNLNVLCSPFNSEKDVTVEIPTTREWLHGSHLEGFLYSLQDVRDSYAERIAWIENLSKSEVDEIITILVMIVKELDDDDLQASPGQEGTSKTGLETIITEMVKIVKNYNDADLQESSGQEGASMAATGVGLQESPGQEGASVAGTASPKDTLITPLLKIVKNYNDADLQESSGQEGASMAGTGVGLQKSPGQEGASMAGTASIKDTIRTELVKFLKNYNGEDLLARKANDTPMKYPTASGLNKIIRDLREIMREFNHLCTHGAKAHVLSAKGFLSTDALDSDLPAQTFQQRTIRNAMTSGIKKLHRDSVQTTRWLKVIVALLERLQRLEEEAHLTGSDATLVSDGSDLLERLMIRLHTRREVLDRLVEEIQQ